MTSMPVPSTPTATDALLERKKILEENAALIGRGDRAREETALWEIALAAVKKQFATATDAELDMDTLLGTLHENFTQKKETLQKEIDGHTLRRDTAKADAEDNEKRRDTAKTELEKAQKTSDELDTSIHSRRAGMREEERSHNEKITFAAAQLSTTKSELDAATAKLEAIRKEDAETIAKNIAEETRLSRRANDLLIWEGRVRKMGEKLDPDFKMIL